jgi:uncharacterized protein (DUF3084 family)
MPSFQPGWNVATLMWVIGGCVTAAGLVTAAFVTARYSLLSKVLDAQEALSKRAEERADKTITRFDVLEGKLHVIEAELNTSRGETLAARQEVLALKQQNIELITAKIHVEAELTTIRAENKLIQAENKRLSAECDTMRRQMNLDSTARDTIG